MLAAHSHFTRASREQSGFTLVEVLVTFVILAIGLLGIVSLQALSKTSQHQSIQRTRAVSLADGLLERIRINPAGLTTYLTATTSKPLGGSTLQSTPGVDCVTAVCTPAQLATRDMWAWEQALLGMQVTVDDGGTATAAAGLIKPYACIQFAAVAGKARTGILSVVVQWSGLRETTDAVQSGDAVEVICGTEPAGTDKYRRQVIASTFVIDEAEL